MKSDLPKKSTLHYENNTHQRYWDEIHTAAEECRVQREEATQKAFTRPPNIQASGKSCCLTLTCGDKTRFPVRLPKGWENTIRVRYCYMVMLRTCNIRLRGLNLNNERTPPTKRSGRGTSDYLWSLCVGVTGQLNRVCGQTSSNN